MRFTSPHLALFLAPSLLLVAGVSTAQGPTTVTAWNDLGMHCIDPDFSVFSLLPPYNNVHAQLVVGGVLQRLPGSYTVSYRALGDPQGSINVSSIGKTNFWAHVQDLFGVALPPDVGLVGYSMPGPSNVAQLMGFDTTWSWFRAEGIPITPIDDAGAKNPYPLMEVTVRNAAGVVVASTRTTVPTSSEMTCSECHASNASPFARPQAGWVRHADPVKDDHLNILRLHDELNAGDPLYASALADAGYAPGGLLETVQVNGVAVLCDRCHFSNALGIGMSGITPMTQAIHGRHAGVMNLGGDTLEAISGRDGCYSCHPGRDTQCLRGAMGKAIGADGDFAMQCQSCHGSMSAVGSPTREGWFDEPNCQNCHTGSATHNNGEIRYTSVYEPNGVPRQAVSALFATTSDVPLVGSSLYRFSTGHGGLQCSACHGPPHAIYPTSVANDNLQNEALQGHAGTLVECSTCHSGLEDNEFQGPHGMHPPTQKWVTSQHGDAAGALAECLACHGADARGSVLARAQTARTFNTPFGPRTFWRGFQISCHACHDGPTDTDPSPNHPPAVVDRSESTPSDAPLALTLAASDVDPDTLTFRIVDQPAHGTVGLSGATATYRAAPGFTGQDSFTYAAWDGKTNSNLGTLQVVVGAPLCVGGSEVFGFGTIGTGGFLPRLTLLGCPTPGGPGALVVEEALGGSVAVILGGFSRAEREFTPGSVLRVGQIGFKSGPLALSGSGAGQGRLLYPFQIPPTFPPIDLVFQAFVQDPSVGLHWASTNGLEVRVR